MERDLLIDEERHIRMQPKIKMLTDMEAAFGPKTLKSMYIYRD